MRRYLLIVLTCLLCAAPAAGGERSGEDVKLGGMDVVVHRTLGGLTAPVMYQGGTLDFGVTPALRKPLGAYDQTPPPKYYVEFAKAGHLAWSDLRPAAHEEIIAYSLAFLDHYVRGLPASPTLTQALPGVAALRYNSELGTGETGPNRNLRRSRGQRRQWLGDRPRGD